VRAKQHFGVRRTPVPGKVCFPYVTGHRQQLPRKKTWLHKDSKKKFRPKRAEIKLYEFFLAVYRGKVQMKGYHIDPAPPGEAEAYAKKAVSLIKGSGLGELEMFCVADEFEEFWDGDWKIDKEKKRLVRGKGEKHRRARKGWRKALATIKEKAQLRTQLKKEKQREDRRLQQERIRRAWENLEKPQAPVTRRPYI
jgi:hypothetical protein